MKATERIRERLTAWPHPEYLKQKDEAGWQLVALEWEREIETEIGHRATGEAGDEIPYGLRVAGDCLHLEENPAEMEVLKLLAELVVQDVSFPRMAEALNQREFRTREGRLWTAVGVFKLTPRLIEVAPRIMSGKEWESRKKEIARVAWNS